MIYHLAMRSDWEHARAQGAYTISTRGRTLLEEGFIHASTAAQVAGTYQRFYADTDAGEVVLLVIDEERLRAPVVVEQLGDVAEAYPHVYGPIGLDAVVEVRPYP